jgi:hypothetical protein
MPEPVAKAEVIPPGLGVTEFSINKANFPMVVWDKYYMTVITAFERRGATSAPFVAESGYSNRLVWRIKQRMSPPVNMRRQ